MCSCPQCRNQDTAQRQINVFKMPANACEIVKVTEVQDKEVGLNVEFGDGHASFFPSSQFNDKRSTPVQEARSGMVPAKTWDAGIVDQAPTLKYATFESGTGMSTLLHKIRKYGFAFVEDMPATPEATQGLLESIGPIRNTHYGGFYDFTSDLASKDTAYTAEALEPHTDNTYFTEPAGLQALHMLAHTDGSGGLSSLVDGFAAADKLFKDDVSAYQTLSRVGVYAHASGNEGVSIQPAEPAPVFTHHEYGRMLGHIAQVRWNNADRAGLRLGLATIGNWYDAAAKFDAIISESANQYWFQLKPGTMLLFDNWRVLHGRSAFTGKRRMCGGYINRDDFISKYRTTNLSQEELLASTVTG
ncbi:hypothetical protein B0A50_04590 [Salinomyces thailandicus]|uniref:TauD/TfdA-like domain-containing protein n=1 Tax=Salinomyces thailandicus TaxID=706561 RepID=A0A4U0TV09_9PEZI|nr:hypothetical protein B0A50_04590 [Salinomyces thailandica]